MNSIQDQLKTRTLTPETLQIIAHAGTETPGSGKYCNSESEGSYVCRHCGHTLFRSESKFLSHCGWPSFDECIDQAVKSQIDPDGMRTEIQCAQCHAHLGHVFTGENYTSKNTRYCVNSLALDFADSMSVIQAGEAIVAGGCFWGIDHLFSRLPGVLMTESGYSGGHVLYPDYEIICTGTSGHYECVRILFDTAVLSYQDILRYFFEIHHSEQTNGQGADIGPQYRSAIFTHNDKQKHDATQVIDQLKNMNIIPTTAIIESQVFWPAEEYHQNYLTKHPHAYCHHTHCKIFDN